MKFLKSNGTIEEGVPLTERQAETIDRLTDFLHEKVCRNAYHGTYSAKPCQDAADLIVPKLDDSSAGSLCSALWEPEAENVPADPIEDSPIETLTTCETSSQPISESPSTQDAAEPAKDDYPF